jgi:hypothetical protein
MNEIGVLKLVPLPQPDKTVPEQVNRYLEIYASINGDTKESMTCVREC